LPVKQSAGEPERSGDDGAPWAAQVAGESASRRAVLTDRVGRDTLPQGRLMTARTPG